MRDQGVGLSREKFSPAAELAGDLRESDGFLSSITSLTTQDRKCTQFALSCSTTSRLGFHSTESWRTGWRWLCRAFWSPGFYSFSGYASFSASLSSPSDSWLSWSETEMVYLLTFRIPDAKHESGFALVCDSGHNQQI